jgi:hypothetical protein
VRLASLCLLSFLSACARGGGPTLGDADQVRLDALVEATAGFSTAAVCLDVDPRDSPEGTLGGDPFERAEDPAGPFWVAASRIGHIYPQSRCSRGQSAQGLVPVHPEGSERPGIFVTLGAVSLSSPPMVRALICRSARGRASCRRRPCCSATVRPGQNGSSNIATARSRSKLQVRRRGPTRS